MKFNEKELIAIIKMAKDVALADQIFKEEEKN